MATYPHKPHKPNFMDIRTMQVFDPQVIGEKLTTNAYTPLSTTAATLENGVRIKNLDSDVVYVSHRGISGASLKGNGFSLIENEEVFIETRFLQDIIIIGSSGGGTAAFIAS